MSASPSTKDIESFFKSLAKAHKPGEVDEPMNPINELIYSFLLWNTTTTKANVAFRKITSEFSDLNEFRVTQAEDIAELLGVQYPHLEERVARLLAGLKDVYNREHEVSIASCIGMNKRDGRQYLETIEGAPPFVSARMTLVVLGAHAVPVDDRMMEGMIEAELFEEGTRIDESASLLERGVRASDGLAMYHSLQAWADAGVPPFVKKSGKKTTKKKTQRKASRSS